MQRIATLLSSEPASAGAHACVDENEEKVFYGFGKKFGGKAMRRTKPFKHKRNHLKKKLASVKGCWVCGKNHNARGFHSPQEIIQAVNRIKNDSPKRAYTTREVNLIQEAYAALLGDGDDGSSESEGTSDDDDEANFTEMDETQRQHHTHLTNIAFSHGHSFTSDDDDEMRRMACAFSFGEKSTFDGIILDTGANRVSAMSLSQYKAYCREFGCALAIDYSDNRSLNGIGGKSRAIGTAIIPIPFNSLGVVLDVKFRIMKDHCPSLLSLRDMIDSGMEISIQDKTVSIGDRTQEISFENDFLKYKWKASDMATTLYTEQELRRLHKHFGHPTTHAMHKLLRTARPDECDESVRKELARIVSECDICQRHAPQTRRFKLTVGTGPLTFNHTVAIDIMYIGGKPVLHVVDEATHYSSATFLKKVSAEETWKALLRCWSRVYVGPPDHIRVDQGSQFVSKHFLDSAEGQGIEVVQAGIESPSTMTHVERYHGPLRSAYEKIRES